MRRSLTAVAVFTVVAVACGSAGPTPTSSIAPVTTSPRTAGPTEGDVVVLLEGSFQVPAANAFGDAGFHETFVLTGTVPEVAAGIPGEMVVRLSDLGRPAQTCSRDHPLSGCVTVDWSDFEDRSGVPPGGVFDNHLTIVSSAGATELFLSERRGLATTPDQYAPT